MTRAWKRQSSLLSVVFVTTAPRASSCFTVRAAVNAAAQAATGEQAETVRVCLVLISVSVACIGLCRLRLARSGACNEA